MAQKLDFQYFWRVKHIKLGSFNSEMIGRTVISIVKWISCKIILVKSQKRAAFSQFNRTHAIFLLVILMVNMLSRIKSLISCLLVCLTTYLN